MAQDRLQSLDKQIQDPTSVLHVDGLLVSMVLPLLLSNHSNNRSLIRNNAQIQVQHF